MHCNQVVHTTPNHDRTLLQVCIPGLHISLGIFYRLYELLEAAAHELDLLIAITLSRDPSQQHPLPHTFQEYVEFHRRATAVAEEANELFDHADFCDSLAHWSVLESEGEGESSEVQALRLEAQEARQRADEMVGLLHAVKQIRKDTYMYTRIHMQNRQISTLRQNEPFPVKDGPCVQQLEKELVEMGVQRQAYYSGTFVGNHVHKCCKV